VPRVADRRAGVHPAVAALVERMLAKHPAERPQSAREALASLDEVVTPGGTGVDGTTAASTRPAAVPLIITPRQSQVMLGVLAVSLVVAAVITATWWATRP